MNRKSWAICFVLAGILFIIFGGMTFIKTGYDLSSGGLDKVLGGVCLIALAAYYWFKKKD
ncbi:MAG: hypothetical protein MJ087_06315 [Lachnospiraceae bacterium]|nr:hypothetical protein [Lachnospiraceae bacterium]